MNSVTNKILLLKDEDCSNSSALDLPLSSDIHMTCTPAAFSSLLKNYLPGETFPGHSS